MPQEQTTNDGGEADSASESAQVTAPEWTRQANQQAEKLVEEYKQTLRQVAEAFSTHQREDVVSTRRVDEAHSALVAAGLSRLRWLTRPDTETAVGGALIGLAWASSDLASIAFDDAKYHAGATKTCFVLLIFFGIALFSHGSWRGRLPSAVGKETWFERILNWINARFSS